jgi:hypothetical protein
MGKGQQQARTAQAHARRRRRRHVESPPLAHLFPSSSTPLPSPHQIHLNFPTIVTSEARARRARKAVINRCRAELAGLPPLALLREEVAAADALARAEGELRALEAEEARLLELKAAGGGGGGGGDEGEAAGSNGGGAQPEAAPDAAAATAAAADGGGAAEAGGSGGGGGALHPLLAALDWEAVVDVPHGSLRLPGCYKAPWMDKDPAWVEDKCYSMVEWWVGPWGRERLGRRPCDPAGAARATALTANANHFNSWPPGARSPRQRRMRRRARSPAAAAAAPAPRRQRQHRRASAVRPAAAAVRGIAAATARGTRSR